MLLSKYAIYDTKKIRFIKKQEANGLLSSLEVKTTLSKIPLLGNCFVSNAISSNVVSLNDLIVIIIIL